MTTARPQNHTLLTIMRIKARPQLIGNGLLMARVSHALAGILSVLQMQGGNSDALLSLSDAGWQEALHVCDRMRLTLPLALRSSMRFPAWVNERLEGNLTDTARKFVRIQTAYREAAAVLADADVAHLVLKGFALSPDYVATPQFRVQGDIDFYTRREFGSAAVEALKAIGYRPAGPPEDYRYADHAPTLVRFRDWKRSSNRFDPDMPLALEVHFCLWNANVSLIQLPETEDFWQRRILRKLGELTFCSLDGIDQLAYFALHLLRDVFLSQAPIHHALELATFLHGRADDSAFWRKWRDRYSPRLRQMQAISLALAAATFSSRLSDAVHEEIGRLPAEQRVWVETCGGDLLVESFRRTRDGRLLQLLLADSASARRTVLWRAVSSGRIAEPAKVASWREDAVVPQLRARRWLRLYPSYLVSRVALNGAAVARFLIHGMTIFVSTLALRHVRRRRV